MPGTWLIALGCRILRQDTFDRVVAPAIADLQFERNSTGLLRHYVGILIALVCALGHDVRLDAKAAFGADARRSVWPAMALSVVVTTAISTAIWIVMTINGWRFPEGRTSYTLVTIGFVLQSAALALPAAVLPAAAMVARSNRSSLARRLLLIVAMTATASFAAQEYAPRLLGFSSGFNLAAAVRDHAAEPVHSWSLLRVRNSLFQEEMPTALAGFDIATRDGMLRMIQMNRRRPAPAVDLDSRDVAMIVSVGAFSLIGAACRRRSLVILIALAALLQIVHFRGLESVPGQIPRTLNLVYGQWSVVWLPTILLLLSGMGLAGGSSERRQARADPHVAHRAAVFGRWPSQPGDAPIRKLVGPIPRREFVPRDP